MTAQRPLDLVVERLEAVGCDPRPQGRGWRARCPAHADSTPSLDADEGADGRALVICRAGCDRDAVLDRLGLDIRQLFADSGERRNGDAFEIAATYPYVDENGALLFEVVRLSPKGFRQRRPDGKGGWSWKLGDTRRVLYRLPEVLAAAAAGERVFVTEGEKDADAVVRAGAVATTNPGGAGKWRSEYGEALRGADVVVVADRDAAGLAHARQVEASLRTIAASVVVVEPVEGKDAADHLAAGHTLDDLRPMEAGPGPGEEPTSGEAIGARTFSPIPLDLTRAPEPPRLLHRFLYAERLTVLQGEPGSGKTWLADWIACDLLAAGSRVIVFDEEGGEDLVTERLVALGADPDAVAERLSYFAFEGRVWDDEDLAGGDELLATMPPASLPAALAIFDSLPDFLAAAGLSEDNAGDVTAFVNRVCRRLLGAGVAVLLLDHLKKPEANPRNRARSRYARGSGAKLAKADATLLVEVVQEFDANTSGRLRLLKTKDRRGRLDVPGMHSDGLEIDVVVEAGGSTSSPRLPPLGSTVVTGKGRPSAWRRCSGCSRRRRPRSSRVGGWPNACGPSAMASETRRSPKLPNDWPYRGTSRSVTDLVGAGSSVGEPTRTRQRWASMRTSRRLPPTASHCRRAAVGATAAHCLPLPPTALQGGGSRGQQSSSLGSGGEMPSGRESVVRESVVQEKRGRFHDASH